MTMWNGVHEEVALEESGPLAMFGRFLDGRLNGYGSSIYPLQGIQVCKATYIYAMVSEKGQRWLWETHRNHSFLVSTSNLRLSQPFQTRREATSNHGAHSVPEKLLNTRAFVLRTIVQYCPIIISRKHCSNGKVGLRAPYSQVSSWLPPLQLVELRVHDRVVTVLIHILTSTGLKDSVRHVSLQTSLPLCQRLSPDFCVCSFALSGRVLGS
jgi:hypothetical protein